MRNRILKKLIIVFLLAAATAVRLCANQTYVSASSATSKTYTRDYRGNIVYTQDAYKPQTTFVDFGLSEPRDIIIYDNVAYVADGGNARVLMLNSTTAEVLGEIKNITVKDSDIFGKHTFEGEAKGFSSLELVSHDDVNAATTVALKNPVGLFKANVRMSNLVGGEIIISYEERLYIADIGSSTIFILDNSFNCLQAICYPDSNLYRADSFDPASIAVDTGGNMYVVCEGLSEGIMQFAESGEFVSYFSSNKVIMEPIDYVKEWLYTDEQKANDKDYKKPPIFTSVYADAAGLIYSTTTTDDDYVNFVKKHDTSGKNKFTSYPMVAEPAMEDIYTDKNGIVYAITQYGDIFIYTPYGEFINVFGSGAGSATPGIVGLFEYASAIAVDDNLNIWVIDTERNFIQTFKPTDYSLKIYDALNYYFISDYQKSIEVWNEVLELNQMSNLAHNNIGLNYLYSQEYDDAMEHLKISNNKGDYSKAYWEVRNIWLQANLTWIICFLVGIVVVGIVLKEIDKRKLILDPVRGVQNKVRKNRIYHNYMYMFTIARHPENGFYDLKCKKHGSYAGAWMIFATLFIVYLLYISCQGFIYQTIDIIDIDFVSTILGFVLVIGAAIICNYLVTSITNGIGGIKDIFKLVMYSMGPIIVGLLSITIISHFLTNNEAFFLSLILYVTGLWSIVLMCMGMQEIQGYTLWELLKSILLTILLLIIIVLVLLIVTVLSRELLNFIQLIWEEAWRNVLG